jgi:hypothetical protein
MMKLIATAGLLISLTGIAGENDFVYLNRDDVREIAPVIHSYFENYLQVLQPIVNGDYSPVKSASLVGPIGKAQFNIEFANGEKIDFRNVKIQLNKEGRGGFGEYGLIAVCVGSDCNKIFATLSVREDGDFVYNWPLMFKLVDGVYKPAFQKAGENYDESENETETKAPPQLVVKNLVEAKIEEHMNSVVNIIRDRMEKKDAAYSGEFFLGLQTVQAQFEFEKNADELTFSVSAHYGDHYRRKDLDFKGTVGAPAVIRSEEAKTSLEVIPVDGTDLILFLFDQEEYRSSVLPEVNRGMAAYVCSVVVENNAAFHDCRLFSTSYVFGTIVLEGKVHGPIFVRPGQIVDAAALEAIKEEERKAKESEAPEEDAN